MGRKAFFTFAKDYGIDRLFESGRAIDPLIDSYNQGVEVSEPVIFGKERFKKGANDLERELTGKDLRSERYSNGYLLGIDGFILRA